MQAVVSLPVQYRMAADIMDLANTLFYASALRCGTPAVAEGALAVPRTAALAGAPAWLQQVRGQGGAGRGGRGGAGRGLLAQDGFSLGCRGEYEVVDRASGGASAWWQLSFSLMALHHLWIHMWRHPCFHAP